MVKPRIGGWRCRADDGRGGVGDELSKMSGADEPESNLVALVCREGELENEKGESVKGIDILGRESIKVRA